jgi:D-arginine dehydrogenase
MIARSHRLAALERAFAEAHALLPSVRRLGPAEAQAMVPVLRAEHVAGAMYQPDAKDIDVDALHRGYLAATKAAGGRLVTSVEIRGLIRDGGHWHAQTNAGDFAAKFVINAAGAWCDELAKLAGIAPIGLVPKRRTVITFDPPPGIDIAAWPIVIDVDETYYFKPEAGRLLATPADETPMPACDVQPDELDIALTVERVEAASSLKIRRIVSKWAGLRSFVADKTLVAGFEPGAPGFFWLAGQGGYGIQTSPAMSQIVAALIEGRPFPSDLVDLGLSPDLLAPARLRAV